jgi:hypothetical protein
VPDVRACNIAAQTLAGGVAGLELQLKYKKAELKQGQEEQAKLQVGEAAQGSELCCLEHFVAMPHAVCGWELACLTQTLCFITNSCCRPCRSHPCLQREVSVLQKAAADAGSDPAVAKLQQQVAQQRESLAKLEGRVNAVRDRMFADFRCPCSCGGCCCVRSCCMCSAHE